MRWFWNTQRKSTQTQCEPLNQGDSFNKNTLMKTKKAKEEGKTHREGSICVFEKEVMNKEMTFWFGRESRGNLVTSRAVKKPERESYSFVVCGEEVRDKRNKEGS